MNEDDKDITLNEYIDLLLNTTIDCMEEIAEYPNININLLKGYFVYIFETLNEMKVVEWVIDEEQIKENEND